MTHRPIPAVALAAAFTLFVALHACTGSESTTGNGNGNTGAGGTGTTTTGAGGTGTTTTGAGGTGTTTTGAGGTGTTTTGAGGTGTTTTGAGGTGTTTTGAGGTSGGGVCPVDPAPEANCNTTLAKTGATCMKDCCITCGYQGMGQKICSCSAQGAAGTYTACPCPKPATYMGAPTAAYCDGISADGMTATIKGTACTTMWQECVGRDLITGTTYQGCVCLNNATTNTLQWVCGSTNKWFNPM